MSELEFLRRVAHCKEAQEAAHAPAPAARRVKTTASGKSTASKSTAGKSAAGKSTKSAAGKKGEGKGQSQPLSAWLAAQRDTGRLR